MTELSCSGGWMFRTSTIDFSTRKGFLGACQCTGPFVGSVTTQGQAGLSQDEHVYMASAHMASAHMVHTEGIQAKLLYICNAACDANECQ